MLVRRSGGKGAKSFFYISALALAIYVGYYLTVLSQAHQSNYRPRYSADDKILRERDLREDFKPVKKVQASDHVVQTRIHFQKPQTDNRTKLDPINSVQVRFPQTEPIDHPVLKPLGSIKPENEVGNQPQKDSQLHFEKEVKLPQTEPTDLPPLKPLESTKKTATKAGNQPLELGIKNTQLDVKKMVKPLQTEPTDRPNLKPKETLKRPEAKAGNQPPELGIKDTQLNVEKAVKPLQTQPTDRLVLKPVESMKKLESKSKNQSLSVDIEDPQKNVVKVPPIPHRPSQPLVPGGHILSNVKQFPRLPPHAPRRYLRDSKAFQRYMDYLNKKELPLPMQNKAVIILTNHRSGSSFFGELFNQHPDAFYMFEPLLPLGPSWECMMNSEWKIEVLKKLVQCELPNWPEIYKKIPVKNQVKHTNGNLRQCILKKMCFRMNTNEVCQDHHCPRSANTNVKNCVTECGIVNPDKVNNDCRRKELVALKLIRLCDIMDLEYIVKNISTDIKVLHLIRDPRGIANSRMHVLRGVNIKESIHGTCKRQSHNMMSALVNTPEWLKGKYMVVRYEDAALYPYETAESVYRFVNLTFPEEMKQWISKNTDIKIPADVPSTMESPTLEEATHSIVQEQHRAKRAVDAGAAARKEYEKRLAMAKRKKKPGVNPYGTKRNSTATVQKWAINLPYNTVQTIERECVNIMKMAGYIPIGTLEQYKIKEGIKYFKDEIELKNET